MDLLDLATGCPVRREKLPFDVVHQVFEAIGLEDLRRGQIFSLDDRDLGVLRGVVDLRVDDSISGAELMIWHLDMLPLENSHTRRELWLMLRGEKPLAAFVDVYREDNADTVIPERFFLPYVQEGRLVRREVIEERSVAGTRVRRILYAVPSQEWRIDAYLALWELASRVGWLEGFEQLEGYLLGYEPKASPRRDATSG
jgi:hypothetical protein